MAKHRIGQYRIGEVRSQRECLYLAVDINRLLLMMVMMFCKAVAYTCQDQRPWHLPMCRQPFPCSLDVQVDCAFWGWEYKTLLRVVPSYAALRWPLSRIDWCCELNFNLDLGVKIVCFWRNCFVGRRLVRVLDAPSPPLPCAGDGLYEGVHHEAAAVWPQLPFTHSLRSGPSGQGVWGGTVSSQRRPVSGRAGKLPPLSLPRVCCWRFCWDNTRHYSFANCVWPWFGNACGHRSRPHLRPVFKRSLIIVSCYLRDPKLVSWQKPWRKHCVLARIKGFVTSRYDGPVIWTEVFFLI